MNKIQYRPEIDGLRAIAIFLVFAFHLSVPGFSFGFIGVDLFFVISGFLITKQLKEQIDHTGKISFMSFYIRRLRRLAPSLIVSLLLTTIAAFIYFPPYLLENYLRSLFYSFFYLSNFWFWSHTSYFDINSHAAPLLHTWSLAVEEQYYLIWPAFLLLVNRLRDKVSIFLLLTFLTAVGFVLFNSTIFLETTRFFLLPFRLFEFLLGALAFFSLSGDRASKEHLVLIQLLAISLIVFPFLFFDITSEPIKTLISCFGVALFLNSPGRTIVTKVFGCFPMVIVGKISYALYLVHWPIIVFCGYVASGPISDSGKVLIVCVSFLLSWSMTEFIENNIRVRNNRKKLLTNKQFLSGLLVISAVAITVSQVNVRRNFLDDKHIKLYKDFSSEYQSHGDYSWHALRESSEDFQETEKRKIIVIGDSMAGDFLNILNQATYDQSKFEIRSHILDVEDSDFEPTANKLARTQPDAIILARNWDKSSIRDFENLILVLREKTDAKIFIVGLKSIEKFSVDWQKLKAFNSLNPTEFISPPKAEAVLMNEKLQSLSQKLGLHYIDTHKLICIEEKCPTLTPRGQPFFYDDVHITKYAVEIIAKSLAKESWYSLIFPSDNR